MKPRLVPWERLRRSLAWKLLPDADLNLTVPGGLQFPLTRKGDQIVFSEIVLGGLYAPFFAELPAIGSFVDLGCNCGFFTGALMLEAQRRGWNLERGLLVDAELESVALARAFLRRNHADFAVARGLVGRAGQEEIFTTSRKSQRSGAKTSFEPARRETLRAQSLAELLTAHQLPHPDLLKIDIEGSEIDLLEQESELLASLPHVILEWHAPHCSGSQVRDWIARHGLAVRRVQAVLPADPGTDPWAAEVGLVLWSGRPA